jgi:SH3 domain protein
MKSLFISCLLLLPSAQLLAESVYITDKLEAGLHEDKSVDSPILKIVATGTRLEIVKREDLLSYVRDANGITGWINNQYLMANAPDTASLKTLQTRMKSLETRLSEAKDKNRQFEASLKRQGKVLPEETRAYAELKTLHADLKQTLNTEKIKAGELQIELTELRARVGQDEDSDSLYRRIKSLEEAKKKLEIQLANTLESYAGETGNLDGRGPGVGATGFSPDLRNMTIYLAITLILGLLGGAYLLDLINRRRHGGFRI